jgi:cystinosin
MLSFFADICGWIYFVSWTFLYYPQIYLNYKKKSVAGLSYDFVSYTILGSTAYFLFNMILFFSTKASKEYMNIFELSKSPIQLNDFVFATNSLLSCLIFVYQCMIYEVKYF